MKSHFSWRLCRSIKLPHGVSISSQIDTCSAATKSEQESIADDVLSFVLFCFLLVHLNFRSTDENALFLSFWIKSRTFWVTSLQYHQMATRWQDCLANWHWLNCLTSGDLEMSAASVSTFSLFLCSFFPLPSKHTHLRFNFFTQFFSTLQYCFPASCRMMSAVLTHCSLQGAGVASQDLSELVVRQQGLMHFIPHFHSARPWWQLLCTGISFQMCSIVTLLVQR